MGIWKDLLADSKNRKQLSTRGYTDEIKFTEYTKKYQLEQYLPKNGAKTAKNLSIDFFSSQSKELTSNNYFLLRTGQGRFVVINQDLFDSAYLELKTEKVEDIQYQIPKRFGYLIDAYDDRLTENPSIELMHALGVFKYILKEICGETEYQIGPRGNRTSTFDVYLKNRKSEEEKIYTHSNGQEELDYSVFTKKAIFTFEAKCLRTGGFDIGWHKLAYPLTRFRKYPLPKYPCYFLNRGNDVLIYIFPEFRYYNQGVLLNDKEMMKPTRTFRVDLSNLRH